MVRSLFFFVFSSGVRQFLVGDIVLSVTARKLGEGGDDHGDHHVHDHVPDGHHDAPAPGGHQEPEDEPWELDPARVQAFLLKSKEYAVYGEGKQPFPKTSSSFRVGFAALDAIFANWRLVLRGTIETDPDPDSGSTTEEEKERLATPGVWVDKYAAELAAAAAATLGYEPAADGKLPEDFSPNPSGSLSLPTAIAPTNPSSGRPIASVPKTRLGGQNVIGVGCGNKALTVEDGTFGIEMAARELGNGDFKWFSHMDEEEKGRITSHEWGGFGQDGKKGIITPNGIIIDLEIALISVEVNLNVIGKGKDEPDIPLKNQSLAIIRDWRIYPDEAWSLTPGRVQAFLVKSADYGEVEIPKTETHFGLGFGGLEAFAPDNNVKNFQGMRLKGTITTEDKGAPGLYMDDYANKLAYGIPKAGTTSGKWGSAPQDGGALADDFDFSPKFNREVLGGGIAPTFNREVLGGGIAPTNNNNASDSVVESADYPEFGRNVIGLSCANEGLRVENGNVNPVQGETALKDGDFCWFSDLDDETKRLITSNGWTFTGRDSALGLICTNGRIINFEVALIHVEATLTNVDGDGYPTLDENGDPKETIIPGQRLAIIRAWKVYEAGALNQEFSIDVANVRAFVMMEGQKEHEAIVFQEARDTNKENIVCKLYGAPEGGIVTDTDNDDDIDLADASTVGLVGDYTNQADAWRNAITSLDEYADFVAHHSDADGLENQLPGIEDGCVKSGSADVEEIYSFADQDGKLNYTIFSDANTESSRAFGANILFFNKSKGYGSTSDPNILPNYGDPDDDAYVQSWKPFFVSCMKNGKKVTLQYAILDVFVYALGFFYPRAIKVCLVLNAAVEAEAPPPPAGDLVHMREGRLRAFLLTPPAEEEVFEDDDEVNAAAAALQADLDAAGASDEALAVALGLAEDASEETVTAEIVKLMKEGGDALDAVKALLPSYTGAVSLSFTGQNGLYGDNAYIDLRGDVIGQNGKAVDLATFAQYLADHPDESTAMMSEGEEGGHHHDDAMAAHGEEEEDAGGDLPVADEEDMDGGDAEELEGGELAGVIGREWPYMLKAKEIRWQANVAARDADGKLVLGSAEDTPSNPLNPISQANVHTLCYPVDEEGVVGDPIEIYHHEHLHYHPQGPAKSAEPMAAMDEDHDDDHHGTDGDGDDHADGAAHGDGDAAHGDDVQDHHGESEGKAAAKSVTVTYTMLENVGVPRELAEGGKAEICVVLKTELKGFGDDTDEDGDDEDHDKGSEELQLTVELLMDAGGIGAAGLAADEDFKDGFKHGLLRSAFPEQDDAGVEVTVESVEKKMAMKSSGANFLAVNAAGAAAGGEVTICVTATMKAENTTGDVNIQDLKQRFKQLQEADADTVREGAMDFRNNVNAAFPAHEEFSVVAVARIEFAGEGTLEVPNDMDNANDDGLADVTDDDEDGANDEGGIIVSSPQSSADSEDEDAEDEDAEDEDATDPKEEEDGEDASTNMCGC